MTTWYHCAVDEEKRPRKWDEVVAMIKHGQLDGGSAISRDAYADWKPLSELPEFAAALKDHGRIGPPAPVPARPWPRFAAKMIDLILLEIALVIVIVLWAMFFSPVTLAWVTQYSDLASKILLPFSMIFIAICMTAFGTTPGKKWLGLDVVLTVPGNRLLLHLKRELGFWLQGMAIALPIASYLTMLYQLRRVSEGQPTSYEKGFAVVRSRKISRFRSYSATVAAIAVIGGGFYGTYDGLKDKSDVWIMQTWQNPITKKTTELSRTWSVTVLAGSEGKMFEFVSDYLSADAFLGEEIVTPGAMDGPTYASDLQEALNDDFVFNAPWKPVTVAGHSAWRTSMTQRKDPTTEFEVTVSVLGRRAWRTVVSTTGRRITDVPAAAAFSEAAMKTID